MSNTTVKHASRFVGRPFGVVVANVINAVTPRKGRPTLVCGVLLNSSEMIYVR